MTPKYFFAIAVLLVFTFAFGKKTSSHFGQNPKVK